jgi:hypothetical protein
MLNWTVPGWPSTAANRDDASAAGTPFDLAQAFEAQTRLWNHFLDTNRSLWALYAPWMQGTPWMLNGALEPVQSLEEGKEPAKTVDGLPDALESQARLWNQMIDANRSFWSVLSWPGVDAVWPPASSKQATEVEDVTTRPVKPAARASRTASRKKAR